MQYVEILTSYIYKKIFSTKYKTTYSDIKDIQAGFPLYSVLGSVLRVLLTSDMPKLDQRKLATVANNIFLI